MRETPGNIQLVQKINRLNVLNYIRRNPNVARPTVARATGLSTASLTNITSYLISIGLVAENGFEQTSRIGRKASLLKFNADSYGIFCVFFKAKTTNIYYTNLLGKIISHTKIDTNEMPIEESVNLIAETILKLTKELDRDKILGVSFTVCGMILDNNSFLLSASLQWARFGLKQTLEKKMQFPVFMENISNIKATWLFIERNYNEEQHTLFVNMEDGIGACQFYQGKINHALLGEIGHTTVKPDGDLCFCGNSGCLERMSSVEKIKSIYREKSGIDASISEIAEKYRSNNENAIFAVKECAYYLGIGFANLVTVCRTSEIVIDPGDFSDFLEVIELAIQEMHKRVHPAIIDNLKFSMTNIEHENIVKGAAFSLCDRLFDVNTECSFF